MTHQLLHLQNPISRRDAGVASICVGVAALMTLVLTACASSATEREASQHEDMTPVEAACSMLRDGEKPEFVYGVMVDLLEDHSYQFPNPQLSARLSVDKAIEDGCQS